MYRYRHNDVPKWYFACTEVVQQKAHVPKWISYVPKSSCTESVHPFVPKLSCTESDVTPLAKQSLSYKPCTGQCMNACWTSRRRLLADCQVAHWTTCRLDNSRTRQLADAIGDCVLSFRSFGGICETASCPVRELTSARVV